MKRSRKKSGPVTLILAPSFLKLMLTDSMALVKRPLLICGVMPIWKISDVLCPVFT